MPHITPHPTPHTRGATIMYQRTAPSHHRHSTVEYSHSTVQHQAQPRHTHAAQLPVKTTERGRRHVSHRHSRVRPTGAAKLEEKIGKGEKGRRGGVAPVARCAKQIAAVAGPAERTDPLHVPAEHPGDPVRVEVLRRRTEKKTKRKREEKGVFTKRKEKKSPARH